MVVEFQMAVYGTAESANGDMSAPHGPKHVDHEQIECVRGSKMEVKGVESLRTHVHMPLLWRASCFPSLTEPFQHDGS